MQKVLLISLMVIFLFNSCNKQEINSESLACLPSNLQTEILAFYQFSKGSINDSSGNNNHLSNSTTATPGYDREENAHCAYLFNYTNNEYLIYDSPTFLDNIQFEAFSISLWFKSDSSSGILVSRGIEGNNCRGGVGEWRMGFVDQTLIFYINGKGNIAFLEEVRYEWHHLVVTNNSFNTKIYFDGALLGDSQFTFCTTGPELSLNVGDLIIGKNFAGTLDDIIIYSKELSQEEINQLSALSPCCN